MIWLRFFCLFLALSIYAQTASKIPWRIWQTYKSKNLPAPAIETERTWLRLNPEYSHALYDDADIEAYIRLKWPMDYLDLFHALPIGAMKADLWRYLILATEGGVYADIDSICIVPIAQWPFEGRPGTSHALLLDLDSNQSQFCQWVFASTPHHPAMLHVCETLLKQWKQRGLIRSQSGAIDVLASTGPGLFTAAIKNYLGESEETPAFQINRRYANDKDYRKRLNRLGIYFTPKKYFSGAGAKNLFWGSSGCLGDAYNGWGAEASN